MTDLKKFAADMLTFGKGAAKHFRKINQDFVPTFVMLKNDQLEPIPFPAYAQDRELHIGLMKMMLDGVKADAYALIMEAWMSEQKPPHNKTVDLSNVPRASLDPNRKECLVVQCGSREGQEIVLMVEIKQHNGKLTFENEIDMTEGGRSVATRASNMFGTETIN